ncbi:hypothetical protein BDR22DRAFT_291666 [Usnea florida]
MIVSFFFFFFLLFFLGLQEWCFNMAFRQTSQDVVSYKMSPKPRLGLSSTILDFSPKRKECSDTTIRYCLEQSKYIATTTQKRTFYAMMQLKDVRFCISHSKYSCPRR